MAEILPAILPYSFEELEDSLRPLVGVSSFVHLDACDGRLHGDASWPYNGDIGGHFARIETETEGFPFWEKFDYEVHLMVREPEIEAERWIRAGATRIIVHAEALTDHKKFASVVSGRTEVGVALNLDTSPHFLSQLEVPFDFVQCMSIAEVGRQGMPFEPTIFEKIKDVRALFPNIPIGVDGGVGRDNAEALLAAGATRLIIGSAIMQSDDIRAEVEFFKNL